jgi:diketogulonate reductase-like aldo/keto reductase
MPFVQVIQQWMNQNGVTPISHSNNKEHILDNMTIPKWRLHDEEIYRINSIKEGKSSTCDWQQFLNKELLDTSQKWISKLNRAKL